MEFKAYHLAAKVIIFFFSNYYILVSYFFVKGIPLYVSLPHFLNCEKKLIDSVQSLHPNIKDHEYKLSIDPVRLIS